MYNILLVIYAQDTFGGLFSRNKNEHEFFNIYSRDRHPEQFLKQFRLGQVIAKIELMIKKLVQICNVQ